MGLVWDCSQGKEKIRKKQKRKEKRERYSYIRPNTGKLKSFDIPFDLFFSSLLLL